MAQKSHTPTIEEIRQIMAENAIESRRLLAALDKQRQEADKQRQEADKQRQEAERQRQEEAKQRQEADERRAKETKAREELRAKEIKAGEERREKEMQAWDERREQEIKVWQEEWDKRFAQMNGEFNSRWGRLMESLVAGDLVTLLHEYGIDVKQAHERRHAKYNNRRYEFDIIAVNGKDVVVVEVKTTLRVRDVNDFIAIMEHFKKMFPEFRRKRVLGAVAYLTADSKSDLYAQRQKLFVIRATGSSASIINPEDFKPRKF